MTGGSIKLFPHRGVYSDMVLTFKTLEEKEINCAW